ATFGRYDIACIARFPTMESLKTTVTAIQRGSDAVRSVHAYPAYSSWENATTEHSLNGWTFIRSSDPTRTNESIRKAGSGGVIIETTGQADSLARSGANDMEAFFKSVLKDIQNAPGVRYTETLLASKDRSDEHTSELQSHLNLVCRLQLEKKKKKKKNTYRY